MIFPLNKRILAIKFCFYDVLDIFSSCILVFRKILQVPTLRRIIFLVNVYFLIHFFHLPHFSLTNKIRAILIFCFFVSINNFTAYRIVSFITKWFSFHRSIHSQLPIWNIIDFRVISFTPAEYLLQEFNSPVNIVLCTSSTYTSVSFLQYLIFLILFHWWHKLIKEKKHF